MNVEDMNDDAVDRVLEVITAKLNKLEVVDKITVLDGVISLLDDLDADDFFGTEGWRHSFGLA